MKPTSPSAGAQVFSLINSPTRLIFRLIAGAGVLIGAFLFFADLWLFGVPSLLAGIGFGVASFFVTEKPMQWVEVNDDGIRRVAPHAPTLDIAKAEIQTLFILEVNVFRVSQSVVSQGYTRYELYVDGHLDFDRFAVDSMVGDIHHEAAQKRGALLTGGLEYLRETGAEIAAACGATLEDAYRTLPFAAIPEQPTELETTLTPALMHGWADASTRAAVCRELGRIGSKQVENLLQKASQHQDAAVREAAAEGLRRLSAR